MSPQSLFLSFVLFSSPLFGLVLSSQSVWEALEGAELVVEGVVEELQYDRGEDWRITWTAALKVRKVLSSKESLKAIPNVGTQIFIKGLGGEWEQEGLTLSGMARPYRNRHYRMYLNSEGQSYRIAGFDQGLIPIDGVRAFSRNRTDGSNGEGNGPFLFWDDDYFPIPYYISAPTFKPITEFIAAIDGSFETWKQLNTTKVDFIAMGCATNVSNGNDGINNVIYVDKNWPFESTIIAITRNFYIAGSVPRAGLILDSDILLNGVDHEFTIQDKLGAHDVRNIMTHEVGHLLGLGHEVSPEVSDATMFAVASPNEILKRTLHPNDIAGIEQGYLGVRQKTLNQNTTCQIGEGGSGCLSVRRPMRSQNIWVSLAYLILLLSLGRIIGSYTLRTD